jgi:glycerate kinase
LLGWPASLRDGSLAYDWSRHLAELGATPTVVAALIGRAMLPGATDQEVASLRMPVAVLPSAPADAFHPRAAVDSLLGLLPSAAELPGCPAPPRPDFAPHLAALLDAVTGFALGVSAAAGIRGEISAMGHVVIAPDKFKGSLSAAEVAAHVAAGLRRAGVVAPTVELPVADGGDGTVDAAVAAGYGRVFAEVTGPTGSRVVASFALLDGTAVIEAAQACGLALLSSVAGGNLAPLTATSRGVGELILAAIEAGATRIVLGLGGVATNDGGAGLAQALGARLLDASGRELPPGGAALANLATLDFDWDRDLGAEFLVASDVDNPLLGRSGAAAVYGPQKGASPEDVAVLDAALGRWADVAERTTGTRVREIPGAGAAGGLGFAALLFLGARLRPGIELLLDMLSFPAHLDGARLVITGEGSLDTQTLRGKAPAGVARAAAAHEPPVPVVAVAGVCSLTPAELESAGIAAAYALTDIESDVTRCMTDAGPLTERLAARIASDWLG